MKEDLKIYRQILEYCREGVVVPYDDYIIEFLATHRDASNSNIKTNYLDALNSTYSISKCYRFARYLSLCIKDGFVLNEGKLSTLYKGDFPHSWIETEDSVYDTAFIGKWPKDVYYDLFKPVVEKVIDVASDKQCIQFRNCTVLSDERSLSPFLSYINWYSYMSNRFIPNPFGIAFYPTWLHFPQDLDRVEAVEARNFVESEWKKVSSLEEIPSELLTDELRIYIEQKKFIVPKFDLYKEFIQFISENRALYEANKNDVGDITLWKKAMEGKCSGSFSILISDLPRILEEINRKKVEEKRQVKK